MTLEGGAGPRTLKVVGQKPSPAVAAAMANRKVRLGIVEAKQLRADTAYKIKASHGSKGRTVPIRTLPRQIGAAGATFILASCFDNEKDNSERIGTAYRTAIGKAFTGFGKPLFKLLVGDNIYLDSRSNREKVGTPQEIVDTYLANFFSGSYAGALARLPNFVTYDDHEIWNNYPEENWVFKRSNPPQRRL